VTLICQPIAHRDKGPFCAQIRHFRPLNLRPTGDEPWRPNFVRRALMNRGR
jgi:hypothetical protein